MSISNDLRGLFLLVDAAGPLVQTGLWQEGKWLRWVGSRAEAGRSVFAGTRDIFLSENIGLGDLSGFFFCEGPGSMLGIRIAAMAIRSWKALSDRPLPVFTYRSHDFLARVLLTEGIQPPFHVISDARRNRWNLTSVDAAGNLLPLDRLSAEEVKRREGTFFRMEEPIRNQPPIPVQPMDYRLEAHAARFFDEGLLHPAENAEPLVLEAPQYQKWHADRHR